MAKLAQLRIAPLSLRYHQNKKSIPNYVIARAGASAQRGCNCVNVFIKCVSECVRIHVRVGVLDQFAAVWAMVTSVWELRLLKFFNIINFVGFFFRGIDFHENSQLAASATEPECFRLITKK